MKKLVVFSVLMVIVIGLTTCHKDKGGPAKSKACEIKSFVVGDKTWNIEGLNITATYKKGSSVSSLSPIIEVSPKAKVEPKSGVAQDFSNNKKVTYTVTAEDGKTKKIYTAQATVETN